ncbi:hypothetical protein Esti_003793 [Eimeria stiedai]
MALRAKQNHLGLRLLLLLAVYPRGRHSADSSSLPPGDDNTESWSTLHHWGSQVNEGESGLTETFPHAESSLATVDRSAEQDIFIERGNEEKSELTNQVGVIASKQPRPRDTASPDEESYKRLAAVRGLAPAAERLAKAAGTHEAEALLNSMHASLSAAEKAKQEEPAQTQVFLDEALSALSELQQVAVKAGEAFVADGPPSIADAACLAPDLDDLLDFEEAEALAPFRTYLRSLSDHYDRMTAQMREAGEHLQASGQLKDEGDRSLLVSAAADLEVLRQAVLERRHTADVILATRNKARALFRTLFLRKSYQLFRELDGEVDLQSAYFTILEEETLSRATKGNKDLLELENNRHLQEIRRRLEENGAKLSSLIDEAGGAALKFSDIVEKSRKIADAQQQLKREFMQTLVLMVEYFQPPTMMDSRARQLVKQVILRSFELVRADKKDVDIFVASIKAELGPDHISEPSGLQHCKPFALSYLTRGVSNALKNVEEDLGRQCREIEFILKKVEGSDSLTLGVNMMKAALSVATEAAAGRLVVRMLKQESFLVACLQEDFDRIMTKAASAARYIEQRHPSERETLRGLEEQLHAASEVAIQAPTLIDRVHAVADLQTLSDELLGLLQTHARNQLP